MTLSAACATPIRIAIRASAILLPAGAFDATALRIDCAHASSISLMINYTEGAVAGGAPMMICEGFDGLFTWKRLTIDNTGTLVVGNDGTRSVVDKFVKTWSPRALINDEFAILTGKRFIAVRFKFAEFGQVGTPGTLSAAVMLPGN